MIIVIPFFCFLFICICFGLINPILWRKETKKSFISFNLAIESVLKGFFLLLLFIEYNIFKIVSFSARAEIIIVTIKLTSPAKSKSFPFSEYLNRFKLWLDLVPIRKLGTVISPRLVQTLTRIFPL